MNSSRRFQAHPARKDRTKARRLASVAGIVTLITAALMSAVPVLGHEVSGIQVDCEAKTLTVSWVKFGGEGDRLMTVTGEGSYSESFLITTDSGSHAFPLPPNGHGQVDWTDSGDFGPVPFVVDCAAPSPTPEPSPSVVPPTPTPTAPVSTPRIPDKTPPGTDSIQETVSGTEGPTLLIAFVLFGLAAAVMAFRRMADR